MAYADPEVGRVRDRARFRRRVAGREAAGLCTRCGRWAPRDRAQGLRGSARRRSVSPDGNATPGCAPPACPGATPAKARAYARERSRREAEARREAGLCVRCGPGPGRARPQDVRAMPRQGPAERPGAIPPGQGRRAPLRWPGCRSQANHRPYRQQEPSRNARCRRQLHAMRPPSPGRGRHDVRTVQDCPPQGGPRALRRQEGRRTVRQLRRAHDRRRVEVRAVRRPGIRAPGPRTEKRSRQAEILGTEAGGALYGLQFAEPWSG